MKALGKITEDTAVSISLLIVIIGGVFWLSTLYAKTNNTAEAVSRIEDKSQEYQKTVDEINLRLTRIEAKLE